MSLLLFSSPLPSSSSSFAVLGCWGLVMKSVDGNRAVVTSCGSSYALLEVWCLFAPELRRDCLHSLAESFPSSLNQLFSTFDLKLPSGDRCGCLLDENSKQLPALSSLSNLLR